MVASDGCSSFQGGFRSSETIIPEAGSTFSSPDYADKLILSVDWGLAVIWPAGIGGPEKVFGLSESQIARRVKAIARAAGLADWEIFSGHSGRVGMARRMTQNGASIHEIVAPGPRDILASIPQSGPMD